MLVTTAALVLAQLAAQPSATIAPAMAAGVTVFKSLEGGYHTFLNPAMVRLPSSGALLVFSEARKGSGGDGDTTDVAFKRSADAGETWSELRSIVPNEHTTLGNNVAVVVNRTTSVGGERVVLVFCANNTLVWQIHSDDAGLHWSDPTDITSQVKQKGEGWIATGPVQKSNKSRLARCSMHS